MRILKYTLHEYGAAILDLPEGSHILSVADQCGALQLWAEADTNKTKEARKIHVVFTGDDAPEGKYIGTALTSGGNIVRHVYDATHPKD